MGKIKTLFLIFGLTLISGCTLIQDIGDRLNSSTIVLYTPITFCQGVYSPDGNVVNITVYIYRVNSIINNRDVPVTLRSAYFFLSPEDARLPVTTSRTLATFPDSVSVGPGETLRTPGALSLRAETASRDRLSPSNNTNGGYRVSFPILMYDPTLRGVPGDVIPIRESGSRAQALDPTPCSRASVLSLVESTP